MPSSSPMPKTESTSITVDPTPLIADLSTTHAQNRAHFRPSLDGSYTGAGFLRRAASIGRTEQQTQVRVTTTEHLLERWLESGYTYILLLIWNKLLLVVAGVALFTNVEEKTSVPLRTWIVGFAIQCGVRIICLAMELYKFNQNRETSSPGSVNEPRQLFTFSGCLELANGIFQYIWWIIGLYWLYTGGSELEEDAPHLYGFCVLLLALDLIFVSCSFCPMFILGLALCCCLPCIEAVMYLSSNQEGETREDIARLPKFTFKKTIEDTSNQNGEMQQESFGGLLIRQESNIPTEIRLVMKDCECVICGDSYADGCTLLQLPCNHIFHSSCVQRWLQIKPLCPLSKGSVVIQEEPTPTLL